MYGGLGKVGLDYEGKPGQQNLLDPNVKEPNGDDGYQVPAFSAQARQLVQTKLAQQVADGEELFEDD